jgi:hypothetical protein
MKHLYFVFLSCISLPLVAQVDSTEIRKPPVLSDLPIIYDRNLLQKDFEAMEKPVFQAQPIEVAVESVQTRFENHPAIKLKIPEVSMEDVQKSWTRDLKKFGDGKLIREGNIYRIQGVNFEEVSSEVFDVEMQFKEEATHTSLWLAMEMDSAIVTPESHSQLFTSMQEFLQDRGEEAYYEKVENDVNDERKLLDGLEKELNGLVKDNERMHKKISDSNIAINQTNVEIDQNAVEMKISSEEGSRKKAAVSSAYDKETEKEAKKELKKSEKDKKSLQKDREKLFQNIIDYKMVIAQNEQQISQNLTDQKNLLLKIQAQTLRIEGMKDKLDKIK